ncbi:MAG: HAMP domain-containing protein [Deltaproteobacteria bacterium]|nr:HAMP domain-containing protein [Deltaproteobacteria bacterium]MCB9478771.1 HAMP domain-containing protein [Deltaproteobacteria bacterium]MCB9488287.1 HAMP domain-containing protein [Deltaproteobacteria bacterium]
MTKRNDQAPAASGMTPLLARLPRVGLRTQLIAFMIALTIVFILALGTVWLKLSERNFIQMKFIMGQHMLSNLQSMLTLQWGPQRTLIMGDSDQAQLVNMLQVFANNHQLPNVFIVNGNGEVLAHLRYDMIGQTMSDPDLSLVFDQGEIVRRYVPAMGASGLDERDEVIVMGPLFLGDKIVAAVQFSLAMDDVIMAQQGAKRLLTLYALLTALVTVLVGSIVLVRLVIEPLENLTRATDRIREGDLNYRIRAKGGNEMAKLAAALHRLQEHLAKSNLTVTQQRLSLRKTSEQLELAERQVVQQDRLAYVGRVAASVAHEVGNPLGAIYNYLNVLESSIKDDPEAAEILELIQSEIARIDRIMKELLVYSRPEPPLAQPVDIARFLRRCVDVMRHQRQLDGVQVNVETIGDLPTLMLDEAQFKQVLLNIIVNAVHAMGGGGRIDISARVESFDEMKMLEYVLVDLDHGTDTAAFTDLARRGIALSSKAEFQAGEPVLVVHVRDHGPGLSKDAVQKVFELFFTTKAPGKGTGLGLAICQKIVEGFGGILRFESFKGSSAAASSTVVSIYLPVQGLSTEASDPESLLAAMENA